MKIFKILLLSFFLSGCFQASAQKLGDFSNPGTTTAKKNSDSEFSSFKERLFFGGGLGLSIGERQILVDVSPMTGVKINKWLQGGFGFTYKYYRYNNIYRNVDLINNIVGGSIFTRVLVYKGLYARVEYEYLQLYQKYSDLSHNNWIEFNSFFVGGGYIFSTSDKSAFYLEILSNLNDTPDSPYTNPIIRVGFMLGFIGGKTKST